MSTLATQPPEPGGKDRRSAGRLMVTEIFGPTFQGEGPSAGRIAAFVRLSRCHFRCRWCDTPHTWDRARFDLAAESRRMTQADVWRSVDVIAAGMVVITGGEPLLQQDRLAWLAGMCRAAGRRVEVETNGAVAARSQFLDAVCQFNVSLKLANSGMPVALRLRPPVIEALASSGKAVWKFVVTSPADLDEIAELEKRYALAPVWVMPEGTDSGRVIEGLRELAGPVLDRGWNLTPRLHTILWEDTRGR